MIDCSLFVDDVVIGRTIELWSTLSSIYRQEADYFIVGSLQKIVMDNYLTGTIQSRN